MIYQIYSIFNNFTVQVSPKSAVCPLADYLAEKGWAVPEVRLYAGTNSGVIILYRITHSQEEDEQVKFQLKELIKEYELSGR